MELPQTVCIFVGGIQLQDFTSRGRYTSAHVTGLKLQHGVAIHVTVVATNAAGLSTVVYTDPIIVDLTPPVIETFEVSSNVYSIFLEKHKSAETRST